MEDASGILTDVTVILKNITQLGLFLSSTKTHRFAEKS
jgi:hypothetical protein